MKNRYIVKPVDRDINEVMDAGEKVFHIYDRQNQTMSVSYYLNQARADIQCVAKNVGNEMST